MGLINRMERFLDLVFFFLFLPICLLFWFFQLVFFWPTFLFGKTFYQNLTDLFYKATVPFQRKEIIERIKRGSLVLDVGSGNGYLAKFIAERKKARVSCVDVLDSNKTDLPFELFDGVHLPFKDKMFDFVILSFVLHHAQAQEKLLKECARVCRGEVLVLEDEPVFQKDLFAKAHEAVYNLLYNLKGEVTYHSLGEWKKIFKKCDLEVLEERSRWSLGSIVAPMKRAVFVLKPK